MRRVAASAAGAHNSTFDRTAGSHPLAAAGQRERYAEQVWKTLDSMYRCAYTRPRSSNGILGRQASISAGMASTSRTRERSFMTSRRSRSLTRGRTTKTGSLRSEWTRLVAFSWLSTHGVEIVHGLSQQERRRDANDVSTRLGDEKGIRLWLRPAWCGASRSVGQDADHNSDRRRHP